MTIITPHQRQALQAHHACLLTLWLAVMLVLPAWGAAPQDATAPAAATVTGNIYVREYRVKGAHLLNNLEVGEAVYPFLGPGRTTQDIDQACAALEKAYHDKGYQTVTVTVPPQPGTRGIVFLQVEEMKVGKLRVKDSRFHLPGDIRRRAPSLAPGTVPNFNDVQKDIVALNRSADLRVTPVLNPGVEPGTVDIDLNVKDKDPLHGSIELNNRYSPNTTPLRLNGSISYGNLWQLGQTFGFSFQVAPQSLKDAEVFSAYYTIPVDEVLSLTLQGTKQDSNVSTLGGTDSVGRGQIIGARANVTLPADKDFFHSLSLGMDYKHFDEVSLQSTSIDYFPMSMVYGASWVGANQFTELNAGLNFHFRGMGSDPVRFDAKRFNADGSYIYFRGDLTHTHDLPGGFEMMAKVQGQIANHPLINNEQLSGGGQSTVRGYLESVQLGDNGAFGTLELRSPSFIGKKGGTDGEKDKANDWRVYAFVDAGTLTLNDPLPEQKNQFNLASVGVGTRIKLRDHFNGSFDVSLPMIDQGTTLARDVFLSFRLWADF